jgi:hypothetical protein
LLRRSRLQVGSLGQLPRLQAGTRAQQSDTPHPLLKSSHKRPRERYRLPLATLAHNNTANSTTGFTPSQLLIGWELRMTLEQAESSNNQTAEQLAKSLRNNRTLAIEALNRVANRNPAPDAKWKQGQMVWLEAKNLALPYGTVKLTPRRHRPFRISKVVLPVAYQLTLPLQWNIHPVFHASLLTPYVEIDNHGPNFSQPPPNITIGENEYEVETIRSHRYFGRQKKLQYLLKWKGYPESDNTWEPTAQVHAPQLIKQYHTRCPATTIKTLLLRPETNHHSSPWTAPLHPPHPLTAALTSHTSRSLSTHLGPTTTARSSSEAYSDEPRTPLTSLKSSSRVNALTLPTRTPSRLPLRARSATVDSTTDTSRTPWLWMHWKPCKYRHPLSHFITPPQPSSAGHDLPTPPIQTFPSLSPSLTCLPLPPVSGCVGPVMRDSASRLTWCF